MCPSCSAGWSKGDSTIRRPSACRASSRRAAASSTSSLPIGMPRCGSNCSAIRSNRCGASKSRRSAACKRWSRSRSRFSAPIPSIAAFLTEYLAPQSWFMLVEPQEIDEEAKHYLGRLERPQEVHEKGDVLTEIYRFPSVTAAGVASGSLEATCHLRIESVERFSGDIGKVRDELDSAAAGQDVILICQTEAEAERLQEIFSAHAARRARQAPFRRRPFASRLSPRRSANRAGQRQRAVSSRRSDAGPAAASSAA